MTLWRYACKLGLRIAVPVCEALRTSQRILSASASMTAASSLCASSSSSKSAASAFWYAAFCFSCAAMNSASSIGVAVGGLLNDAIRRVTGALLLPLRIDVDRRNGWIGLLPGDVMVDATALNIGLIFDTDRPSTLLFPPGVVSAVEVSLGVLGAAGERRINENRFLGVPVGVAVAKEGRSLPLDGVAVLGTWKEVPLLGTPDELLLTLFTGAGEGRDKNDGRFPDTGTAALALR